MKTFTAFVCILLFVFSITGCSKQAPAAPSVPAAPEPQPAPVAQPAPAAPEPATVAPPAPTGFSEIIGNWSLEEQYQWDQDAKQWAPGILLDDGTMTQSPPEPINTEIIRGIDPNWCPDVKPESGAEYITIIPGGCWKMSGKTGVAADVPPESGSGVMSWEIQNSNLEMDISFKDASGDVIGRNKAVLAPLK